MGKGMRTYKPFAEWGWKRYSGKGRVDVAEFIESHKTDAFFVGTDSQNYTKKSSCVFTSVIIAYTMHKGGAAITHTDKVPFIESLRQRLLTEAMRSLEVAWFLDGKIPDDNFIGVHLDVNSSLDYKSGKYKNELVGLVACQGFNALVKPDAWAASKVADLRC